MDIAQLQREAEAISTASPAIRRWALSTVQYLREREAAVPPQPEPAPAPPPPPEPAPPPSAAIKWGFSTGAGPGTPWGGGSLSDTDCARYLDATKTLGGFGVRVDVGHANDPRIDLLVRLCRDRGLRLLPVVRSHQMAALTPAQYADLCRSVAAKYVPLGITEYELGNEPNLPGFYGAPADPAGWRLRTNAGYDGIKSVSASAVVISGGLAPMGQYGEAHADGRMNQVTFLERALAAGPLKMDVFGYHPYEGWEGRTGEWAFARKDNPNDPWSALGALYKHTPNCLGLLAKHGLNVKVEATEVGIPTAGTNGGMSDEAQRRFLELFGPWWEQQPWARNVWWYRLLDPPSGTTREAFFGLLRKDWTHKPAAGVFSTVAK